MDEPNPNSEPAPDWVEARKAWRWGWSLHWITFSGLFMLLALYSLVALIKSTRLKRQKVARNLSFAVYLLIVTLGLTRALFLVLYPYELKANVQNIPLAAVRLLFGVGFPCLTSAFALIQIAFTESLKSSQIAYSKLGNVKFLVSVVAVHFGIVVLVDITTTFVRKSSFLYLLCIVYFLLMTLVTGLRIIYSGTKVIFEAKKNRKVIEELNMKQRHGHRAIESLEKGSTAPKASKKVFVITLTTGLCCVLMLSLEIYALVDSVKYLMLPDAPKPEPWAWYVFQTCFRLTELALAGVVLYTVSPPRNSCSCCCSSVDKPSNSYYPTETTASQY